MPRGRKKAVAKRRAEQFEYNGVPQFGDISVWNKDNVGTIHTLTNRGPGSPVEPNDLVDSINPSKRYKPFLFAVSGNLNDAQRELATLQSKGYVKAKSEQFVSPSGRFADRDGVLVEGDRIVYVCPEARYLQNREAARKEMSAERIAETHAAIAAEGDAQGLEADAQVRADTRGRRLR
jgi:hypothetical protein